jgi:hypothetical protein
MINVSWHGKRVAILGRNLDFGKMRMGDLMGTFSKVKYAIGASAYDYKIN